MHLLLVALAGVNLPSSQVNRLPIGRIVSLDRRKLDTAGDSLFYSSPRLVTHADDSFLAALTALYAERLKAGDAVLDLMTSHVSHLPPDLRLARVDGHGMNEEELAANPRLATWTCHDLNTVPRLPFAATGAYDAILCCAGIQYLEEPEAVFAECARALTPQTGQLIVSFTDKFFYEKAISGWRERGMATRAKLVRDYMRAAGGFKDICVEGSGTSLLAQLGSISGLGGDPFCVVIGTRDDS